MDELVDFFCQIADAASAELRKAGVTTPHEKVEHIHYAADALRSNLEKNNPDPWKVLARHTMGLGKAFMEVEVSDTLRHDMNSLLYDPDLKEVIDEITIAGIEAEG